jgi:hypothetical protein
MRSMGCFLILGRLLILNPRLYGLAPEAIGLHHSAKLSRLILLFLFSCLQMYLFIYLVIYIYIIMSD